MHPDSKRFPGVHRADRRTSQENDSNAGHSVTLLGLDTAAGRVHGEDMLALLHTALVVLAAPAHGPTPPADSTIELSHDFSEFPAPIRDGSRDSSPRVSPTPWKYDGVYMLVGVAPGSTVHLVGINPMLRFDTEIGMQWERKKWGVGFGVDAWLLKYYERKKVGGGLHAVATVSRRPVYARFGLGTLTGVPATTNDHVFRPAVGALAGFGLEGGSSDITGRFGFDYHLSLDKAGRLNNTFLVSVRLKFG